MRGHFVLYLKAMLIKLYIKKFRETITAEIEKILLNMYSEVGLKEIGLTHGYFNETLNKHFSCKVIKHQS